MTTKRLTSALLASVLSIAIIGGTAVKAEAGAFQDSVKHRQKTKNDWRNIAIGSGALGLLGLLNHDSTLTFLGTAGALYSAYRYEQDRKSQDKLKRARASYFSRSYFYRNGKRYDRKTVWKNGKKYYQFVLHR